MDAHKPLKSGKSRKNGVVNCGEAKAVLALEDVGDDYTAARIVLDLYQELYGALGTERFMEQAYLLWMQRTDAFNDVLVYLIFECKLNINFSDKQQRVLLELA